MDHAWSGATVTRIRDIDDDDDDDDDDDGAISQR